MKKSRYNIIFDKNGSQYWFNTLTKACLRIPTTIGEKISMSTDEKVFDESLPQVLLEKLRINGFIIEDEVDELQIIRDRNRKEINRKDYFLVILPTLNCNLKCWYCIQKHIPSKMNSFNIEKIKEHINYMIKEEGITSLKLEWFGGEPFLYFNEVINPISQYAKDLCKEYHIPFINGATTNATLIGKSIVDKLSNINLDLFQITIDGPKEDHNKVKYNDQITDAFSLTLKNIVCILSKSNKARINLRINYTDKNLKEAICNQVNQYIPEALRHRISISLKKVWQEEVSKSRYENYKSVVRRFEESGYKVTYLDIVNDFVSCYVGRRYYNTINYNGQVYKCTASDQLYRESPGILENGVIKYFNDYEENNTSPSYENEKCLNCIYLPMCMGNCPRDHINGIDRCRLDKTDLDIEKAIIAHIDYLYRK